LSETAEDLELWNRARAGDRAALDRLLRLHEKRVYRFGLRMCGDEEAAREVLQSTLLAAFRRLDSFRGDARLSTWLFAIARSFCSRQHRRTRSAPVHDVPLDAPDSDVRLEDSAPNPAESLEKSETAALVAAAIRALPPSYREVVLLRDAEGLPAEEAARTLGLQVPALKSRLHRARQALKENLARALQEAGPGAAAAQACPRLAMELSALREAEIDRPACEAIQAHVEGCPRCRGSLGALRDAARLCRQLPGAEVPAPVRSAVRRALHEALAGGTADGRIVNPSLDRALGNAPPARTRRR